MKNIDLKSTIYACTTAKLLDKKKKNNIQDTWKKNSIKKQSIKAYQMKENKMKSGENSNVIVVMMFFLIFLERLF